MSDLQSAACVVELIDGVYRTQCLFIVCDLGIPSIVAKSTTPISITGIVKELSQDVDAGILCRIMRYMSLHGVFKEAVSADGLLLFGPTHVTKYLSASSAPFGAFFVQHCGSPFMCLPAINIYRLVKKEVEAGELFKTVHGQDVWEFFKYNENERGIFHKYLEILSATEDSIATVVAAEVADAQVVVDIGGSKGQLMKMIKELLHKVRCIALDLPEVIAQADPAEGVEMVVGDMFKHETIPKADVLVLKHILHDWSDEKCQEILLSCREALPEGGKLICIDSVLPDPGKAVPSNLCSFYMDLAMMAVCGSRERCLEEWNSLLGKGGFEMSKNLESNAAWADLKVIVARKVSLP